ncbi:MAG: PTS sugar transporter subunit IIA [Deltaproteobacteria bacterium]|nr:PTS sugar transporter subunit IIA [Deltaproteobacteria bacterium]
MIFRQKACFLLFYTYPEQVIFPSSTPMDELFDTMVEKAKDSFPDLKIFEIANELSSREKSFSTRLSLDLAIPHAYSTDVSEPICVVAIAPFGLQWESEKASVRLVFLVISPKDDPEIHLNILAEIARILSKASIVHELLRSETSQSFIEKLQKARTLLSD